MRIATYLVGFVLVCGGQQSFAAAAKAAKPGAAKVGDTKPVAEGTESAESETEHSGFSPLNFRLGLDAAYQSTGAGYSLGPTASWNPAFRFSDTFEVVGQVALLEFNTNLSTYFTVLDVGALASIHMTRSFGTEVGASAAYWSGDGGNTVVGTIHANGFFQISKGHFFKKIIGGYSAMMVPNMLTHVVHVGVEI